MNVLGCIMGPLLSGFVLLPLISERWVLFTFALPWLVDRHPPAMVFFGSKIRLRPASRLLLCSGAAGRGAGVHSNQFRRPVRTRPGRSIVLRDNTATIVATGTGRYRLLLVNGQGITGLVPATKFMAHLPLAFLDHPPKDALAVCFGMGTTYRSLLSWDIPVTAVELVPSVPARLRVLPRRRSRTAAFAAVKRGDRRRTPLPGAHFRAVRRHHHRSATARGSGRVEPALFEGVLRTINRRLRPGGILQQWLPYGRRGGSGLGRPRPERIFSLRPRLSPGGR